MNTLIIIIKNVEKIKVNLTENACIGINVTDILLQFFLGQIL